MEQKIFRKKSIDRISSPDQLHDYISVANPSVWVILAAVLLLLIGVMAWGIFGRLDTTLSVGAVHADGKTVCYVAEADIGSVSPDMTVELQDQSCGIAEIASEPVQVDDSFSDYLKHVGGLQNGQWVYPVTLEETIGVPGGVYSCEIIVERIAPLQFVTN